MSNLLRCAFCACMLLFSTVDMQAQNISGHYVSKAEEDGMLYHTLPETLFASPKQGDLTFDITYKEGRDGMATLNFTYVMEQMTSADSIRVAIPERVLLSGKVEKLYVEPTKKSWTHRYSFKTPVVGLYSFFDEETSPVLTIYSGGKAYSYPAKRSAWKSYAPIGYRIFKMIRANAPQ